LDVVEFDARYGAERRLVIKDIREDAPDDAKRFFVAVNGKRGTLADIEWSDIVESENVVSVAVSEQNRVEAVERDAERLLAEVGGGIDHDVLAAA